MRPLKNIKFWSQGTFLKKSRVPISQGSQSGLSRWVFLGQQYPLQGAGCIKTPRVIKTIKIFCTNYQFQLVITPKKAKQCKENQTINIIWTPNYCLILELQQYVVAQAFLKHHCDSVYTQPRNTLFNGNEANRNPIFKIPTQGRFFKTLNVARKVVEQT